MSKSDKHTQILIRAKEIIKNPKHWGKFELHNKKKYCTIGAIKEATYEIVPRDYDTGGYYYWECAERFARANRIGTPVAQWNDRPKTTHAMVMKAFDKAISATA